MQAKASGGYFPQPAFGQGPAVNELSATIL